MGMLGFACDHERCPMTLPTTLPPCMEPDGGECCPEYRSLVKENMQLRNVLEAVREDNERLRVREAELLREVQTINPLRR